MRNQIKVVSTGKMKMNTFIYSIFEKEMIFTKNNCKQRL